MTDIEMDAIAGLNRCSLAVGTIHKRFIRNISAVGADYVLSPRQKAFLWSCVKHYRRQLSSIFEMEIEDLIALADDEMSTAKKAIAELPDNSKEPVDPDWRERNREEARRIISTVLPKLSRLNADDAARIHSLARKFQEGRRPLILNNELKDLRALAVRSEG